MDAAGKLRAYMKDKGIDGVLITSLENMRWYSGFSGDTANILVTPEKEYFITDFRYREMAEKELGDRFIYLTARTDSAIKGLDRLTGKTGFKKLGIEFDKITLSMKAAYDQEWLVNYVSVDGELKRLRSVKKESELTVIRQNAKILEEIYAALLKVIRAGISEFDVFAEMEYLMHKRGVRSAFDPIIAGGPNGSLPHATITNRKLQKGDFLTMDFGVYRDGYCTDFTRTIAIGGVEDDMKMVYNIVRQANMAALEALKPGAVCADVDAVARDIIKAQGFGEYYQHGTGHGVGAEIHEAPWLSMNSREVFEAGMTVTVEPGIYLPGKGGVRIEDMVIITQDGCENLYTVTEDLVIV